MSKVGKHVIHDYIVSQLKLGKQRGEILGKCEKTWGTKKSTFDRMLAVAKQQHFEEQQRIQKGVEALELQAEIERRKRDILTADERKELLTKIARGDIKFKQPFVQNGKIVEYPAEPGAGDRIKAISELNKMGGDYAPTKIDLKDTIKIVVTKK